MNAEKSIGYTRRQVSYLQVGRIRRSHPRHHDRLTVNWAAHGCWHHQTQMSWCPRNHHSKASASSQPEDGEQIMRLVCWSIIRVHTCTSAHILSYNDLMRIMGLIRSTITNPPKNSEQTCSLPSESAAMYGFGSLKCRLGGSISLSIDISTFATAHRPDAGSAWPMLDLTEPINSGDFLK